MNILTNVMPKEAEIDGKLYDINYDFRSCLRIIMAFEDNDLSPIEKQLIMLENLYITQPHNIQEAIVKGGWFLNCGKPKEQSEETPPRVYSFSKDADMIFAAFRQVHQINLETADLHWWAFIALFMSVLSSQENPLGALVSLRLRVKTGRATREEIRAYRELGDFADVPEIEDMTLEEREAQAEFLRIIGASK